MILEYLRLVIGSVSHRRMRAWLTIVGVVIGVAAIISLVSLGEGLKSGIEEQFEALGVSNIRIIPGSLNGPPTAGRTLPNDIVGYVESVKGVDYVDPVTINNAIVEFNNIERQRQVIGADTSSATRGFIDLQLGLQDGRLFTSSDSKAAILGAKIEDEFDKDIFVRNSILINGEKFRVIGIFEPANQEIDGSLYIPLSDARELFDQKDTLNGVVVHLEPGIDIDEAAEAIERRVARNLDEEEFDIYTPQQILDVIGQVLGVVQAVVSGIAAISLIVGAIGIMNVMFTSVLERTREIGVMKAIGARNGDILALFVIESGIIGLVGGVIGVVLGMALALGIGAAIGATGFFPVSIHVDVQLVAYALLFAFLIGVAAGSIPAYRAAKLKPVQALRYE